MIDVIVRSLNLSVSILEDWFKAHRRLASNYFSLGTRAAKINAAALRVATPGSYIVQRQLIEAVITRYSWRESTFRADPTHQSGLVVESNLPQYRYLGLFVKRYTSTIADIVGGCELQVDWSQADQDFYDLFGMGEDGKSAAAWNKTERNERCQPGGTSLIAFGQISPYVQKVEADSTCLGRWFTLSIANGEKEVKIVMVYRPCFPNSGPRQAWLYGLGKT